MVLAGNKATRLSLINHTTKTINYHHHRDHHFIIQKVFTINSNYPLKVVNHIIDQELSQTLEAEAVGTKNHNTE